MTQQTLGFNPSETFRVTRNGICVTYAQASWRAWRHLMESKSATWMERYAAALEYHKALNEVAS